MASVHGYIHNEHDAYLIIHALRFGLISPVEYRPNKFERRKINSGDIFVFIEQRCGIKRWTDGFNWSPSRMKGHFLVYKEIPQIVNMPPSCHPIRHSPFDLSLYKKTISITYELVSYHIVSYFRPIFSKKSIYKIPFFRAINDAIVNNNILLDNIYVKEQLSSNRDEFYKNYNLLQYNRESNHPEINKIFETDAIKILLELNKA